MMRSIFLAALAGVAAATASACGRATNPTPASSSASRAAAAVPALNMEELSARVLKGNPAGTDSPLTLINFWASW